MKLLLTVLFTLSSTAFAFDVPKDAIIKVYTKDGKQIGEMTRQGYKVVKLGTSKVKVVERVVVKKERIVVPADMPEMKRNRVTFKGGVGYDGLTNKDQNPGFEIQEKRKAVFGIGYSRRLTEELSLGASYINNDTTTLDLGYEF